MQEQLDLLEKQTNKQNGCKHWKCSAWTKAEDKKQHSHRDLYMIIDFKTSYVYELNNTTCVNACVPDARLPI